MTYSLCSKRVRHFYVPEIMLQVLMLFWELNIIISTYQIIILRQKKKDEEEEEE